MTAWYRKLDLLRPFDKRDWALERAAIIHETCGCSWDEADERAYLEATQTKQRRLPRVA